jgi:hypothetical protein
MIRSRRGRLFPCRTFRHFGEQRDLLVRKVFPASAAKGSLRGTDGCGPVRGGFWFVAPDERRLDYYG